MKALTASVLQWLPPSMLVFPHQCWYFPINAGIAPINACIAPSMLVLPPSMLVLPHQCWYCPINAGIAPSMLVLPINAGVVYYHTIACSFVTPGDFCTNRASVTMNRRLVLMIGELLDLIYDGVLQYLVPWIELYHACTSSCDWPPPPHPHPHRSLDVTPVTNLNHQLIQRHPTHKNNTRPTHFYAQHVGPRPNECAHDIRLSS